MSRQQYLAFTPALRFAATTLAIVALFAVSASTTRAQEDAQQAWQRLQQMLEGLVDEDRGEPIWANDPWEGNEVARQAWCAAMADTHQSDWSPGMIPGRVRGKSGELDKAQHTQKFFATAREAFAQLTVAAQPEELAHNAKAAAKLVGQEAGVYESYGWDYTLAIDRGATLAPPLGTQFALQLSEHITPLALTQERWCWEDPDDRG